MCARGEDGRGKEAAGLVVAVLVFAGAPSGYRDEAPARLSLPGAVSASR